MTSNRRRMRPKTTVRQYVSDERVFINSSLRNIEELLEEIAEEEKLVQKKKARLMGLREKWLAWNSQEEKVTSEWEQSR